MVPQTQLCCCGQWRRYKWNRCCATNRVIMGDPDSDVVVVPSGRQIPSVPISKRRNWVGCSCKSMRGGPRKRFSPGQKLNGRGRISSRYSWECWWRACGIEQEATKTVGPAERLSGMS